MESEKLKSGIGGGSHYRASGLVRWHKAALLGSSARPISKAVFEAQRSFQVWLDASPLTIRDGGFHLKAAQRVLPVTTTSGGYKYK